MSDTQTFDPNAKGFIGVPAIATTEPTPHVCPVCGGNGLRPQGFYDQVSGMWSSSGIVFDMCRTCKGTGIVWTTVE